MRLRKPLIWLVLIINAVCVAHGIASDDASKLTLVMNTSAVAMMCILLEKSA